MHCIFCSQGIQNSKKNYLNLSTLKTSVGLGNTHFCIPTFLTTLKPI